MMKLQDYLRGHSNVECSCAAHSWSECCCDADWPEQYCEDAATKIDQLEALAADRLEQMNADRKQALVWRDAANRYEKLRKLNVQQFQELYIANIKGAGRFDDLVDALEGGK